MKRISPSKARRRDRRDVSCELMMMMILVSRLIASIGAIGSSAVMDRHERVVTVRSDRIVLEALSVETRQFGKRRNV
jgi:hypothetical protein